MKWLDEVLPGTDQWSKFSSSMSQISNRFMNSIEMDPRIKQLSEDKMNEWRSWFDSRLDNAIEAAEVQDNTEIESKSHKP